MCTMKKSLAPQMYMINEIIMSYLNEEYLFLM